ncbi:hypothetical protein KSP39_PZI009821 [Platanthera zijinensis]|uniref:THUMP domain-containing protein n=1 Tax=Platanthera zijinensis TaxID=2320716 RepID=A0AAP0G6P4_9ASPA
MTTTQEDKEDPEELKPWEHQHSAVISIPRYDYKAPSSLLGRSHSGFLITCPFNREKSATKEAIRILDEHMSLICTVDVESSKPCTRNVVAKRRRTCLQDADNLDRKEKLKDDNLSEDSCEDIKAASLSPMEDENAKKTLNLSLVKLTRSGLLLFTLPNLNSHHVIATLSSIFQSLGSGNLKLPIWCHRIFPIQEICCLIEKDLQAVVTNLVQQFFSSHQNKPERPIKFAVGYNRRGIEETEMKDQKYTLALPLLERSKCFEVVARAFKNVVKNSLVDLKSPEVIFVSKIYIF